MARTKDQPRVFVRMLLSITVPSSAQQGRQAAVPVLLQCPRRRRTQHNAKMLDNQDKHWSQTKAEAAGRHLSTSGKSLYREPGTGATPETLLTILWNILIYDGRARTNLVVSWWWLHGYRRSRHARRGNSLIEWITVLAVKQSSSSQCALWSTRAGGGAFCLPVVEE